MIRFIWTSCLLSLLACDSVAITDNDLIGPPRDQDASAPPPDADDAGSEPEIDAGSSTTETTIVASCALQPANALRVDCSVQIDPPTAVSIEVRPSDGDESPRSFSSDAAISSHGITLFGLRAATTYEWYVIAEGASAEDTGGTFVTGELPPGLDLNIATTGTPTLAAAVFSYGCDGSEYLVGVDTAGYVVWYEAIVRFDPNATTLSGVNRSDQGSILAIVERDRLVEVAPNGELLFDVSREAGDFTLYLHHDALRRDGYIYALNATGYDSPTDGNSYVVDGVTVFEESGRLVREWSLIDVVPPESIGSDDGGSYWSTQFPDSSDYSHTNSLWVDDSGDWYLSSRLLGTVIKISAQDGDDFGQAEWFLVGDSQSPLESDFTITSATGATPDHDFQRQHHAWIRPDGRLQLFDNRISAAEGPSRVLVIDLDPSTGRADIESSYEMNDYCPAQSSAYRLDNGNIAATCAAEHSLLEFDEADTTGEPRFEMTVSCNEGERRGSVYRMVPWPELVQ